MYFDIVVAFVKTAALLSYYKSKHPASKDTKMEVTTDLSFANPAGNCLTLDAIYFGTSINFLEGNLATCTASIFHLAFLELIKLYISLALFTS